MVRYFIVSIVSGILFGILDMAIHANPLARKLYQVYQPIARKTFKPAVGIVIDLIYGFAMSLVFLLLVPSLPGGSGFARGLVFGCITWFFRVVMYAASQWVMFDIPMKTILYMLAAGLIEMLILGVFYGLVWNPTA